MGPFTWEAAIALAGLLGTGGAALLGVWWKIELRIRKSEEACQQRDTEQEKEVANLRIMLAEKYTSWETVKEIEARLSDRIESVSEQLMKQPDIIAERIMKLLALQKQG